MNRFELTTDRPLDGEPTERDYVDFAQSVENLAWTLDKSKTTPTEETVTFDITDMRSVIWPEDLVSLHNIQPELILTHFDKTPLGVRHAVIDIQMSDEERIELKARSDEKFASVSKDGEVFRIPKEQLGMTFSTLALEPKDADEIHLSKPYYKTDNQPIDPTDPAIFELLKAASSPHLEFDKKTRFDITLDNPINDFPVQVRVATQEDSFGEKIVELAFLQLEINHHNETELVDIKISYAIDKNMTFSKPPEVSASRSFGNLAGTTKEVVAKNSALAWANEVIDQLAASLHDTQPIR